MAGLLSNASLGLGVGVSFFCKIKPMRKVAFDELFSTGTALFIAKRTKADMMGFVGRRLAGLVGRRILLLHNQADIQGSIGLIGVVVCFIRGHRELYPGCVFLSYLKLLNGHCFFVCCSYRSLRPPQLLILLLI